MESEPVSQKDLKIDLENWMRTFSVFRRRNASRVRWNWNFRAIISTGIMQTDVAIEEHDKEGRVITLEFKEFYFVTVYTPNSQSELRRLEYRMEWERDFLAYLLKLQESKPVICCGDLNVAHEEIDLKNPKTNRKNAGFTDEERACFTKVLESGFIDTFRYFYPDKEGIYSWWSYRFKAREKNAGWRIDYFITSPSLKEKLQGAAIHTEIMGSDHCPIELDIDLK